MSSKPTIGRILHYVSRGSLDGVYPPVHVPFIVTSVDEADDTDGIPHVLIGDGQAIPFQFVISGWTMNNRGTRYEEDVPFLGDSAIPATCHWPERE